MAEAAGVRGSRRGTWTVVAALGVLVLGVVLGRVEQRGGERVAAHAAVADFGGQAAPLRADARVHDDQEHRAGRNPVGHSDFNSEYRAGSGRDNDHVTIAHAQPCGIGGKAGAGRMTITAVEPDESVTIALEFIQPFKSKSTTVFTLQPDGVHPNDAGAQRMGQNWFNALKTILPKN